MPRTTIPQLVIILPFILGALTGCPAMAPNGGDDGFGGNGGASDGGDNPWDNGDNPGGGGNDGSGSGGPLDIDTDTLGPDGCPTVDIDTSSWGTLSTGWHGGDDPFFQIHDNEPGFYANLEAYTVWGSAWTGQEGTFAPDCNGTGLCFWLVPDDANAFLAVAGEVEVVELSHSGSSIDAGFEVVLRDLTMMPMHDNPQFECLHVPEVVFAR